MFAQRPGHRGHACYVSITRADSDGAGERRQVLFGTYDSLFCFWYQLAALIVSVSFIGKVLAFQCCLYQLSVCDTRLQEVLTG